MKNSAALISCLLLSSLSLPVAAVADAGWYGSANLALHAYDTKSDSSLVGDISSHGEPYRFTAGYQLNDYLSLEAGYVDLGRYEMKGEVIHPAPLPSQNFVDKTLSPRGLVVDATLIYPIRDNMSLYARAGALWSHVGSSSGASASGGKFTDGFGIGWAYSGHINFRLSWDRYNKLEDTNAGGTFSVSVTALEMQYSFQ